MCPLFLPSKKSSFYFSFYLFICFILCFFYYFKHGTTKGNLCGLFLEKRSQVFFFNVFTKIFLHGYHSTLSFYSFYSQATNLSRKRYVFDLFDPLCPCSKKTNFIIIVLSRNFSYHFAIFNFF